MEALAVADPHTVGEFRLRARLGAGGMGQVFLATSLAGRIVAVKVIHPELARDADFIRRFRGEVDAAARVSGMYTAPVVAAGVDDVPPWLATAFVPGPSLADTVSRHGPLPAPALWRLAGGLAEALRAIHGAGLVHRDLKPANVLLASDGPRVIDFGIARAMTETRLTATGSIIGTPGYMSPEQVEGLECGPPGDVFSLGSVLAFAASGKAPFSGGAGGSSASVMYRVVHGEPDLVAVPGTIRELIGACLAKDPARRPDLGQVAAHCAAAADYLGLPAAAFWPDDVARVIHDRQAALTAQLQDLQLASGRLGRDRDPAPGAPTGSGYPLPGPGGVNRRGLLIGAAAAGVAVVGGVAGWALASRSPGTHSASSQPPLPGGPFLSNGSGAAGASEPAGAGSPELAWAFLTGNGIEASPGVGNGVVYVGSRDNYLYAVDVATGKQKWKCQIGWATAAPAAVGDMVCASSLSGNFYAVHAATGVPAWNVSTEVAASFKPNWAVDGGNVILPSVTKPLQAYDLATGSVVRTYGSPGQYTGAVAAAGGVLYVLDEFGTLHALHAASGDKVWDAPVIASGDAPGNGPIVNDGRVYLGSTSGTLCSVDAATGNREWSYSTGGGLQSNPVVSNGMVYVCDDSGNLHAVATSNGKQAWSHPSVPGGDAGPGVAGGRVYVSTELALQALDAKSGDAIWSFTPPSTGALVSTPAVANGLVFIGSSNDFLYAVRA